MQGVTATFGSMANVLSWEVSLGETGKVLTLRSGLIIQNRSGTPVDVGIRHSNKSITMIGTVEGTGAMAFPASVAVPASIVVRPSFGTGLAGFLV